MGKNKHIDLFKDMIPAVDLKITELWDASTDDGRKEIIGDLWNLNRYISSVKTTNRDIQEHFVLTVNEYYNKNWFIIQKHPKLLWMLLCACSYDGKKVFYHEWIGYKKKTGTNDKKVKFLANLYPNKKMSDIELLASRYTDKEIQALAKDLGWDNSEIKKQLK